jgi:hypothetical protein
MKNLYLSFFLVLNFFALSTNAQKYVDPSLGYTVRHDDIMTAFRGNVGVHNILFNRLGFYYTAEMGISGPNSKDYFRDIAGPIIKLTVTTQVSIFD